MNEGDLQRALKLKLKTFKSGSVSYPINSYRPYSSITFPLGDYRCAGVCSSEKGGCGSVDTSQEQYAAGQVTQFVGQVKSCGSQGSRCELGEAIGGSDQLLMGDLLWVQRSLLDGC